MNAALSAAVSSRFAAAMVDGSDPAWRPAPDYLGAESVELGRLIAGERAARSANSDAVAGSLVVLEYARLLSWPVIAAYVVGRWIDPAADNVRVYAGPRLTRIGFCAAQEDCSVVGWSGVGAALVEGHLERVVEAVHTSTGCGRRTLWSNVAAAVAGAFLALSWASPDRQAFLIRAQDVLSADTRLRGLTTLESVPQAGQLWMAAWRRGCCLAFRCGEQPHLCGTCPVMSHDERLTRFARATTRYAETFPSAG